MNVNTFGLIPVAASAPTILSSSQRLHVPINFVIIILSCSQIFSAHACAIRATKKNSSESYATKASVSSEGPARELAPGRIQN
jgi:hypothetical protein